MTDFLSEAAEWKKRKDAHEEREARLTPAERIAAIKERLAASSAGPWRACGEERGGCQCCLVFGKNAIVAKSTYNEGDEEEQPGRREDASFIAHAKQDIPWLLDLVETAPETESAEALRWARDEIERLRAVQEAAKAFLAGNSLSSTTADVLREKVYAADLASWRETRPPALEHMPAWALKRPMSQAEALDAALRSWMEDGHACVSDGTAMLAIRGAQVGVQLRPQSASPLARVMGEVDWTRAPHTARYQDLAEALDAGMAAGLLVQVGVAKFQAYLIDRLLPHLASDAVLDVFVSSDERGVMALRPHGSDAWTLLVMPRVGDDAGYTLALQPPA